VVKMAYNVQKREPGMGARPKSKAAPKAKATAKPKAKAGLKVSQATITKIKDMGMSAALKKAGTSANAEFVEGVKRMYGARRLSAARSAGSAKKPKTSSTMRFPR